VFHPGTNELLSNSKYKNIVCWLIDSDYDEETFFVRHAYFLGVNDPCKLLKTACRAEINEEARVMLNSDNSHPFRPRVRSQRSEGNQLSRRRGDAGFWVN
jgi:adenine-specific DNA-methyltransferase